jgi:heavy metal sensor kinase
MRPLPIRVRLTLWQIATLAVILALFSVFVYFSLARALHAQVDASLRAVASQAAASQSVGGGYDDDEDGPRPLPALLAARGYALRLVTEQGQVLSGTGEYRRLPGGGPVVGLATVRAAAGPAGEPWRVFTTLLPAGPADEDGAAFGRVFLQVGQSLSGVEEALAGLWRLFAVGIPLGLLLAGAGGVFLADRALRPIDSITRQARRIGAEALDRRLDLPLADDEVGRLARTFDEMLDRLEEAFRRERQFTSDAAHELRTPLTVLKGAIGVALRRPRPPEEYQKTLRELEEEVDRLIALSQNLLDLARAEREPAPRTGLDVDLGRVAAEAAERLRALAADKGVALEVAQAGTGLWVAGDAGRLGQAVYNLVGNAIKFTPAGGSVVVAGRVVPEAGGFLGGRRPGGRREVVEIHVEDTGRGISEKDLSRIFDRFFRADRSRHRTPGEDPGSDSGAGLGLTIARSIARAHGGDITVESVVGQGAVFTLRLPHRPGQPGEERSGG